MRYETINDLPSSVKNSLPVAAQKIWMSTFNSVSVKSGETSGIKVAWSTVKQKYTMGVDMVADMTADGKWVKKVNSYDIKFFTKIDKIEILEFEDDSGKKQKKAVLPLTLMDDTINKNGYRLKESEHDNIVKSVKGTPIKMQHSNSDWDIIGTSIDSSAQGGMILSTAEINDPKAVEKFEAKTWNSENMGVSPGIRVKDIVCNICGGSVIGLGEFDHKHQRLQKYDGITCCFDMVGVSLLETSLTSTPAYWPTAGKINDITITASLDKLIGASIDKVDIMTPEEMTLAESKIAKEKATVEAELKSFKEKEAKATEKAKVDAQEAMDAAKKTIESQKTEIASIKTKLDEYVKSSRKVEIEKLGISDAELVESMLEADMTDEQFTAEMDKTKKIMSSVKTVAGSAPIDKPNVNTSTDDEICKEEFGASADAILAEITGDKK